MACARGCDLRVVLAGAIVCWTVAEGIAIAQKAGEVTEDLGNSYLLARRTTGQGSIIETVLYDGQAIVTDIAVPATDMGTTAAIARTLAGGANAPPGAATALPPGFGSGFGGTWLTGEVIDGYLVLHRIRASDPVTHEIFHEGRKVASITEVGPSTRAGRLAGRNSFTFESGDDRFVVRLTQPDGTRILAATEHGHSLGQVVVDRSAALATPPRSSTDRAAPLEPSLEAVGSPFGRSPQPQRLARPQEPAASIMMEEPAPKVVPLPPETVPLPRPSPLPRTSPAIDAMPTRAAGPSPAGNLNGRTPEQMTVGPIVRPKPTITSANPVVPAAAAPATRPAAPTSALIAPAVGPKPAAAVATQRPAAAPAKPIAPAPATAASAAKPKPVLATESSRPAPAARTPRVPPSDSWLQELERATRPHGTEAP
jgi:hypothetical protein